MQAVRLGFNSTVESFKRTKREASYIKDQVRRLRQHIDELKQSNKNPMLISRIMAQQKSIEDEQQV
jgi:hypothetical protein